MDDDAIILFTIGIGISIIIGMTFPYFFTLFFQPAIYTDPILFFIIFFAIIAIVLIYKGLYILSVKDRTTVNPITSFDQIVMVIEAFFIVWGVFFLGTMGAAFYSGLSAENSAPTITPLDRATPTVTSTTVPIRIPSISTDKTTYNKGQPILVTYSGSAPNDYDSSAYLAIAPTYFGRGMPQEEIFVKIKAAGGYPAKYNTNEYLATIGRSPTGTINFIAPYQPGEYEIRMYNKGNEIWHSSAFEVI